MRYSLRYLPLFPCFCIKTGLLSTNQIRYIVSCILLELLCCAKYLYVTLSACPSHVSLDVSNDTQVLVPVCEPILTSGMTVIKLKLQDPQIAQVKTFFSFFAGGDFWCIVCTMGGYFSSHGTAMCNTGRPVQILMGRAGIHIRTDLTKFTFPKRNR